MSLEALITVSALYMSTS